MLFRVALVLFAAGLLAPDLHGQTNQKKGAVLLDALGDPLPDGAIARLGTLRFKHTPGRGVIVDAAIYSPDGTKVASLSRAGGTVRLWDKATGKEIAGPWSSSNQRFSAVAFSPDGEQLAVAVHPGFRPGVAGKNLGTHNTVILYDIAGTQIKNLSGPTQVVHALAFADEGKTLVAAGDGAVRWWDIATGSVKRTWQPFADEQPKTKDNVKTVKTFSQCALSPDASYIALQVEWRSDDNRGIIQRFGDIYQTVEAIGFELATGKKYWQTTSKGNQNELGQFAFSADGKRLAIAAGSDRLELRHGVTGKLLISPLNTKSIVNDRLGGLALSSDGLTMAVAGGDSKVYLYNTEETSSSPRTFAARVGQNGFASTATIHFSPDDKELLMGVDADLQIYDAQTFQELRGHQGHRGSVDHLAFTPDGKRLMTGIGSRGQAGADYFGPNGMVYYLVTSMSWGVPSVEQAAWDVATWNQSQLTSVRTAPWPNFGSASLDQTMYVGKEGEDRFALYDLKGGRLLTRMLMPNKQLTPGAGDANRVIVNGRVANRAASHIGFFSPAGKHFVLYGNDNNRAVTEHIYAVPSGKLVCLMPPLGQNQGRPLRLSPTPADPSDNLAFSPDERLVAQFGRGDSTIRIFDTTTGKLRHTLGKKLEADGRPIEAFAQFDVAFSADNKFLASFSSLDRFLRIWDMAAGAEVVQLALNDVQQPAGFRGDQPRLKLAWSPDGRMLAVGDRNIRLWEVATLGVRRELPGHEDGAVRAMAFSPSSHVLASASADTTVLIWDMARSPRSVPVAGTLDRAAVEKHWQALAAENAAGAFAAILDLAAADKESLAWIKDRLAPEGPIDLQKMDRLIENLNDTQFKVRQSATAELLQIGDRALPVIEKALAAKPSLETHVRLTNIRKSVSSPVLKGDKLRAYRAVEVLEKMATPEARDVLRSLASGAPGGLITAQASAALARLGK